MKILYFTRALPDPLYERLLNEGYTLNNPSNQNFHSRLIASLRLGADVKCVTILPSNIASKDIVRYPGWHYLVPRGILLPLANQFNDLAINDFDIVLFDTLAVKLGQVAVAKAKESSDALTSAQVKGMLAEYEADPRRIKREYRSLPRSEGKEPASPRNAKSPHPCGKHLTWSPHGDAMRMPGRNRLAKEKRQ